MAKPGRWPGRGKTHHPPAGTALHHQHPAAGGQRSCASRLARRTAQGPMNAATSPTCAPTRCISASRRSRPPAAASAINTALITQPATAAIHHQKPQCPRGPRGHPSCGLQLPAEVESGSRGSIFLYELIWKRTVASQMADARLTMVSAQIDVENARFRASEAHRFRRLLPRLCGGSDDLDAAPEGQEVPLPTLRSGDHPSCQSCDPTATRPSPGPFQRSGSGEDVEKEGIGRPSTYASIIGTICDRGYATLQNNSLTPASRPLPRRLCWRSTPRPGRSQLHGADGEHAR